ncbi:glucosamine--fructose-6-phosphate aminotransferase (isomerizing) [Rheinheimera pacifica]|uniref:Glucosamine--fructose-6-phosphate aminotransferase (Isomerizing) n=1 Tax=Rheinheimera pacifica TaxID=173990 RepID=A0A1H6KTW8_9GAMM|nr:SIS domain-containing protein [Rheinheimera pacifica]SEH77361.1 glucosamine--fructose-6-phosphate aminotransferase (isomerizing) [Rheinheimera pacifica]
MTLMRQEASETWQRIQQQIDSNGSLYAEVAERIRGFDPAFVYIVGRGTSDHAGVFARYLIEVELGVVVAAAAPSVASLFSRQLKLQRALVLLISQSGRSEDILAQARAAKQSGALVIALVNDISSPLAALADYAVPLLAGPEKAVAATKSYLCTLAAILQLVAHWKQDAALLGALTSLPQALQSVLAQPAQLQLAHLQQLRHCVVLGRAFGYAISREIALKIKEVCGIQAEAFSSAEFLHGPVSLLNQPLTLLNVALEDESTAAHQVQISEVKKRGAEVVTLHSTLADIHPRLQPLLLMQRFYLDIEAIAVAMGKNPDAPVGLNKVTITL